MQTPNLDAGEMIMNSSITLPSLETHLERMPVARAIALASTDVERLFGMNDVARARLKRFARGHNCIVSHTDGCVVFQKLPTGAA